MKIYVGNLSPNVTEQDLENAFAEYGQVRSAKIIKDMFSGESRGFGFIEMAVNSEAQKAMEELNTKELKGKKLVVNEARNKEGGGRKGGGPRRGGGNRGGGGGGGRRW